jgi:hypothetical protein
MRRIAIFVEGQTELIFVREFLLKWFEYQIDVECRTLFNSERMTNADYDFSCETANVHVQVINVGMDENVLTRILDREKFLQNAGYELIIGLRDMYSEQYKKQNKGNGINVEIIDKFRSGTNTTIQQKAKRADLIRFCYAVMELEAWLIGIESLWKDIDPEIRQKNQAWLDSPESIFHPAKFIESLQSYSKHKGQVESIVGRISREDYIELHESQRCPSFCEFVQHIQSFNNSIK